MEDPFLVDKDPALHAILKREKNRQKLCIELIASENFTSRAVMECLGSCVTNKYSEGYVGRRYYGGNEHIDELETLCMERALSAFRLDPKTWGVNVQSYSGSPANFQVLTALLAPHDRLMGLELSGGGHLTHGFYTPSRKVSATSIFFESLPYDVDKNTGLIDYDSLRKNALLFRPKVIIAGVSAYPRHLDYKRFREIADEVGCYLMADMSHISGLVAGGVVPSPFEYCDVVTSTSHKTLRGPRAAMIFFNRTRIEDKKINDAVFPCHQGGPHNNQIAALACQLNEVKTPEFATYCKRVLENTGALVKRLKELGHDIVTGGSDNHIVLWDLAKLGINGNKYQIVCDAASITLNKNTVPGDGSALNPSGVRVGTPAMTTRGFSTKEFEQVADFLHEATTITKRLVDGIPGCKAEALKKAAPNDEAVIDLRRRVEAFAAVWPMPGNPDI